MAYSKIKKTYGLVLSEANSGDYDKVLTILTSNMGKITVFAKGARRPKSVLLAPTQVFSFSNFVLYEGKTMFYINSADIVDVFYDIRFDYSKMDIGFKILKVLRNVSPENMEVYNYLKLGIITLNYLSKTDKSPEFIYSVFIARLLYEMGVGLNLVESKNDEEDKEIKKDNKKNNKKDNLKFGIYNVPLGSLKEYRYESKNEKEIAKSKVSNFNDNEEANFIKYYMVDINVFSSLKYIYKSKIDNIFNFNLEKDAEKDFINLINKGFKRHINIKI